MEGSPFQEFGGEMSCKTEVRVSPNGMLSARAKAPLPPEYQETPDEPSSLELQPPPRSLPLKSCLGDFRVGRTTPAGMLLICPPFLQEVFQNSPSPFCLLRTLSAGDMAGIQVPPCGSEQNAQCQGKTGVSQPSNIELAFPSRSLLLSLLLLMQASGPRPLTRRQVL